MGGIFRSTGWNKPDLGTEIELGKRAQSALDATERLGRLHVGWELEGLLAAIAVTSEYIYGAEDHEDKTAGTLQLTRQLELPIRELKPHNSVVEILWTVWLRGERLNPEQALAIRAFQDIVRMLKRRMVLLQTWGDICPSACQHLPIARARLTAWPNSWTHGGGSGNRCCGS